MHHDIQNLLYPLENMTKLEAITKQFREALSRMEEILAEEKTTIIRDAALKRFEFTFDLVWKTMRAFLEEKKGVTCISPKECIREAFRQGRLNVQIQAAVNIGHVGSET